MVALSISSHEQTQLNQLIMLFSNIVDFLFLKDPFFHMLKRSQHLSLFLCGVGKVLPVHRYSVDIFHILVLWKY